MAKLYGFFGQPTNNNATTGGRINHKQNEKLSIDLAKMNSTRQVSIPNNNNAGGVLTALEQQNAIVANAARHELRLIKSRGSDRRGQQHNSISHYNQYATFDSTAIAPQKQEASPQQNPSSNTKQSLVSKHRRVTSFDMKVVGSHHQTQPYLDENYQTQQPVDQRVGSRGQQEHNSLIQSRNFGGNMLQSEGGNSTSTRMSLMQTKLANNQQTQKDLALIEQASMLSSYRKKQQASYHHSRNNSQKQGADQYFSQQQSQTYIKPKNTRNNVDFGGKGIGDHSKMLQRLAMAGPQQPTLINLGISGNKTRPSQPQQKGGIPLMDLIKNATGGSRQQQASLKVPENTSNKRKIILQKQQLLH